MKNLNDCLHKLEFYSSESIISFCHSQSRKIMYYTSFMPEKELLPWELETLIMLSLKNTIKRKKINIMNDSKNLKLICDTIRLFSKKTMNLTDDIIKSGGKNENS